MAASSLLKYHLCLHLSKLAEPVDGPSNERAGPTGDSALPARVAPCVWSLCDQHNSVEIQICVLLRPLMGKLPVGKGFAAVGWSCQVVWTV